MKAHELLSDESKWAKVFSHRFVRVGECFEFIGARLPSGYGKMSYKTQNWLAHRLSYALSGHPVLGREQLQESVVRHSCDNPRCINPKHLSAGSPKQNTGDMIQRRRAGWLTRPEAFKGGQPPYCPGAASGRALLTNSDVLAMRAARQAGATYRHLMARFNVAKSTVRDVTTRRSWTHI